MMDQGAVRNLEQIQEHDDHARMSRGAAALLLILGGASVAFATLALSGRRPPTPTAAVDPLGDLVAQHGRAASSAGAAVRPTDLSARDVTFPAILSDNTSPTTALAAVRGQPAAPAPAPAPPSVVPPAGGPAPLSFAGTAPPPLGSPAIAAAVPLVPVAPSPPPATDRLPVMPLPAQNVLEATPVVTRPRDAMMKAATETAQLTTPPPASAAAGHDGGYQLQVSSFRTQAEATQFADQLRARGHKAYVQEAHVNGRGTWFRVRVGPFPSQHAAASYRIGFETKEHVVPFIVPPAGHDAAKP